MTYNKLIENCFFEPQHVGSLDAGKAGVVHSRISGALKGYCFDLYAAYDAKGFIGQSCFKAQGNPYLIAGVEWICRELAGTAIHQHPCLDYRLLIEKLAIPANQYPIALLLEEGYRAVVNKIKMKIEAGENSERSDTL